MADKPKRPTAPIYLTDVQWAELIGRDDIAHLTVNATDDVEDILTLAQETLSDLPDNNPLRCPELADMHVWDASDDDNWYLFITVDLPGGSLASDVIKLRYFQTTNNTPGPPELLHRRNQLVEFYTPALDGITLTREQLEKWAGPLTTDALARLGRDIPDSSIPDAISEIVAGYTSRT